MYIKREDAIKAVNELTYPSSLMDVKRKILDIPAVEPMPEYIDNILVSRHYSNGMVAMNEECYQRLQKAVEPKQGEWMDTVWHGDWQFETDGRGMCWKEYECSECRTHNREKSNFCPYCGARMKGADLAKSLQ